MIEGHGDDLYLYGDKIKHNFSTNIFQGESHAELKKHLASSLDSITNYPEPSPNSIENLLAKKLNVPSSCIMVTNGATEAIHIIARLNRKKRSLILEPTFSEYYDACLISDHKILRCTDIEYVDRESDMLWICNPNNPTGKVYDLEILRHLLTSSSNRDIVVDQAYHNYTLRPVFNPTEVLTHKNLILLYSLTKDYCIPGLRIGYIVSNPDKIKELKSLQLPWSINSLAIEATKFLLGNNAFSIYTENLVKEAQRVRERLMALDIAVVPTDTNFMLGCLPKGEAKELKDFLVKRYGILIRDASNFHGLSSRHFRIAVQTEEENELLVNAISTWMR